MDVLILFQTSTVGSVIASILPLVILLGGAGLALYVVLRIAKKIAKKEQTEFLNKKYNQNNNS